MRSRNSAVIFNFGLLVIRALSLQRSMLLFDKFLNVLKSIRKKVKQNTPHLIWKTTTAAIAPLNGRLKSSRFVSLTVSFWIILLVVLWMYYRDIWSKNTFFSISFYKIKKFKYFDTFSIKCKFFYINYQNVF